MIAQIKILCKGFSIPDYRNGETAEDIDRKELLINSNTVTVRRETYNLDDDELLAWLKIVRNLVDGSIQKEEEKNKKGKERSKRLRLGERLGRQLPRNCGEMYAPAESRQQRLKRQRFAVILNQNRH